eukprot:TRINITY_DN870_c2_g2_i1.p1 TRINITY_DN870_c2_g2~~TRINITY_DN870_c2_g2_i1.p1  ORF type:complete len:408 (+),score=23.97 TRINITY_DN870_c2_g2_i1:48-1271(+)
MVLKRLAVLGIPVGVICLLCLPFWVPLVIICGVYYSIKFIWLVLSCAQWEVGTVIKLVSLSVQELLFAVSHLKDALWIVLERRRVVTKQYSTFKGQKMHIDIYTPQNASKTVIVFIYGGAWCSGNKALYTLSAKQLSEELNSIVVVPDYAYYPCAGMTEMAHQMYSVSSYVEGCFQAHDIYWMGHSAGAHIVTLFFLRMALQGIRVIESPREALYTKPKRLFSGVGPEADPLPLPPHQVHFNKLDFSKVKGLILLSGCFDIRKHLEWERARGVHMYSGMKNAVFGHFEANSPTCLLEHASRRYGPLRVRTALSDFPKVTLIHGSQDLTVSDGQSVVLHNLLKSFSVSSSLQHRVPVGHVDIITELHCSSRDATVLPFLRTAMHSDADGERDTPRDAGSSTASYRRSP